MKEISYRAAAALAVAALIACGCIAGEAPTEKAPAGPLVSATYVAESPAIDGRLGDACWKDVPWTGPLGPFKSIRHTTEPGRVKIGWSHRGLFVGFETEDRQVAARDRGVDGAVWDDDCFEMFLDPSGTASSYFEINVNAAGSVFDYLQLRRGNTCRPAGYGFYSASTMRSAVSRKEGGGWSVEVHLPWENLRTAVNIPPKAADTWRVNFLQTDRDGRRMSMATLGPLEKSAHDVRLFARLRFDQGDLAQARAAGREAARAALAKKSPGWGWSLAENFEEITVASPKLGRFKLMGNGWVAARGYGHFTYPKEGKNPGPGPAGVLSSHPADRWSLTPVTSDPVVVSLPRLPAKAARIWYRMEPARKGALDDGRCDGVGVVLKSRQEEAGKWRTLADIFVTEVEWSLREVDVPEGAELRLEVDRGPADGNHDVAQIAFELKVE